MIFYLRTPDPVSTVKRARTSFTLRPRSPRLCLTDCRFHQRICCWGIYVCVYIFVCIYKRACYVFFGKRSIVRSILNVGKPKYSNVCWQLDSKEAAGKQLARTSLTRDALQCRREAPPQGLTRRQLRQGARTTRVQMRGSGRQRVRWRTNGAAPALAGLCGQLAGSDARNSQKSCATAESMAEAGATKGKRDAASPSTPRLANEGGYQPMRDVAADYVESTKLQMEFACLRLQNRVCLQCRQRCTLEVVDMSRNGGCKTTISGGMYESCGAH